MRRPVTDRAPYIASAREHSERQIKKLAAIITEFGFINPILLDASGIIIAGYGRVGGP
jgi:ParB-like chromosome segregation protein Spo0J